jgi:D-alanyl-D-alanine carboxypeptidase
MQPVNAAPPNLREEICGGKGKRRPRSDNEEEPVAHTPDDSGSPLAMVAGFRLGPPTQGSLIGPLVPSMAPIPVYAGLPKQQPGIELASGPGGKKKGRGAGQTTAAAPTQAAPAQAAAGSGGLGVGILPSSSFAPPSAAASSSAAATAPEAARTPPAKPKAKAKPKPVDAKQKPVEVKPKAAEAKPKPVAAKQKPAATQQ